MDYFLIYIKLSLMESEDVSKMTKCLPPCFYTEYEVVDKKEWQLESDKPMYTLGISYATTKVTLKEEISIYPFSSFLAEFGGALGMFLGFSFFMAWNVIRWFFLQSFSTKSTSS